MMVYAQSYQEFIFDKIFAQLKIINTRETDILRT